MTQILTSEKCRDVIRMGPEAFRQLCQKLRGTGRVKDSIRSTVEEQVAKFLHIIGHNVKTRTMSFFFHRSGETISRHFHNVLHAILSLEGEFFKQPSGEDVPYEIHNSSRFYPFFKDCIGAIDGTHSRVKVSRVEAPRFRGRKDHPTQNILAAYALSREHPLRIPKGKYYLGDAGFMLKPGILTPYRGVRYHLKEYSVRYIMPNKGKKTAEANQPLKDNLRWSDDMDEVLLNALAEEASKGNRHDGSWTTEAYANVVKTLSISIGPHITKNHIKNRMKTLKDHFAEAYDLFHHLSGFAWNPVTRKFEAEEEVWQDFIKEKPQAEKWKKMQIKHYNTLKELFGADRATGKGAATSRERIQEIARDHINLNDSFENVGFSDIDVNMGHDTPTFFANLDSPSGPHSQPNQLGGTSTSRGTKRKSPMNDFLEAQYEKVALGITTMADAVKEGTYLSSKLHDVAQRQVESAKRQASVAERQVSVAEKQVSLIERQVAIA
ncbi:L10-interacting MYB domain-containing protein [Arachis hypogaea]|nr:L10-interacting MYB domain-containing protein [Arachis hypogaea]